MVPFCSPDDPQTQPAATRKVNLFFVYGDHNKDKRLAAELATHLRSPRYQRTFVSWHPGEVSAGEHWKRSVSEKLDEAEIILLLISADFLSSERHHWIVSNALMRHQRDMVTIIPIILSQCELCGTGLEDLQPLPREGKTLSTQKDRESAWEEILTAILAAVEKRPPTSKAGHDLIKQAPLHPTAPALSPAAVELQQLIENIFRRENELREFCEQYFPAESRLFVSGMSQKECVKLLLMRVKPDEIHEQLKQHHAVRHIRFCSLCAETVRRNF